MREINAARIVPTTPWTNSERKRVAERVSVADSNKPENDIRIRGFLETPSCDPRAGQNTRDDTVRVDAGDVRSAQHYFRSTRQVNGNPTSRLE